MSESAPERLKRWCTGQRWTVATAESVTVGRLQALIGSVSGSSAYFLGGVTAYGLEQKVGLLQVGRAHAEQVDCVSATVAVEMAAGAARLFGADLALATTGYAEPVEPGAAGCHMYFAVWDGRGGGAGRLARVGRIDSSGRDREGTQAHYAAAVLEQLLAHLAASPGL